MLAKVKITNTVVTAQYGTLSSGDVLRTTPEFAKHLVGQCKAAVYLKNTEDQAVVLVKKQRKGFKK